MKHKLILGLTLTALMFTACEKEEITANGSAPADPNVAGKTCSSCDEFRQYFKENVAFFDERARSINKENYVKEIMIIDFGNSGKLPLVYFYRGNAYLDTGKGYDKVAGDGKYTSTETFKHNGHLPFDPNREVRSVMPNPLINKEFNAMGQLLKFQIVNEIRVTPDGDSPEPVQYPFQCKYNDNSGVFNGDGDQDVLDALNATGNISCYFILA